MRRNHLGSQRGLGIARAMAVTTIGLLLAITGAEAQLRETPLGSRIERPIPAQQLEQNEAGKVRDVFLNCAWSSQPDAINSFLRHTDPVSADYAALGFREQGLAKHFDLEKCAMKATDVTESSLQLVFNLPTFRALMLERSYLAEFPSPPAWLSAMPAVTRHYVSDQTDIAKAKGFGDLADCIVKTAPVESDAMLRVPSGSAAERAAVQPLVPALTACVPAGQTVELTVAAIRGYVADGLWTAAHPVIAGQESSR